MGEFTFPFCYFIPTFVAVNVVVDDDDDHNHGDDVVVAVVVVCVSCKKRAFLIYLFICV